VKDGITGEGSQGQTKRTIELQEEEEEGMTGEKWPVNLACDSDFRVNHRVL
jgi:hypothetical protein